MDSEERKGFYVFPLHGMKVKLEKLVSKSNSFKNINGTLSMINGTAEISFNDKSGAGYVIKLERDMPRYSVSLFHDKDAVKECVTEVKEYIRKLCAGEACIDVFVNNKGHGALPINYHNL